ncbi:MAG: MFS transporter [Candidatus Hodarchaeales archaeon]
MKRESLQGISRQYIDVQPTRTAMTIRIITTPLHALLGQKLILILLIIVIMETSFSASLILIPFVILNLSAGEIGMIIVAYYISTLSASYFGYLSDQYGRKKLLVFGSFLAALSFVIFPFSEDFLFLLAINSIKGIGSAAIATSILAMFADIAPPGKNGEFMGKYYLARSAGGGLGFIIGGFFWDIMGTEAFLFFAVILFGVCSLFLVLEEPRPASMRLKRFSDFWNVEYGVDNTELNPIEALIDSFKDREFRKFSLAWLCFSSIIGIALTYSTKIIESISEETGLITGEGTFLGIIFLLVAGLVGISQPYLGRLSDNYGRKAFLLLGTTSTALIVVILTPILTDKSSISVFLTQPLSLTTVITLNLGFVISIPTFWISIIMIFLVFGASAFTCSSLGLLTDVTKESERGKSMGVIQTLLSTGSMVGILAGGFAFQFFQIVGIMVLCFLLAMIATAIVISSIDMRNIMLILPQVNHPRP